MFKLYIWYRFSYVKQIEPISGDDYNSFDMHYDNQSWLLVSDFGTPLKSTTSFSNMVAMETKCGKHINLILLIK